MNAAQIHLGLNHFPIFATLFGIAVLLLGWVRKAVPIRRLGLWFFVAAALATVPVFLTGESSEKIVGQRVTAAESTMQTHELAAKFALVGVGLLGLASVLMLFLDRNKRLPNLAWGAVTLIALWVLSIFVRTAYLGGEIRHDEIRKSTVG